MNRFLSPMLSKNTRRALGRESYVRTVLANLDRPELPNVLLIADAGTGKTALVREVARNDATRVYLNVDLVKMTSSDKNINGTVEMAVRFKRLFDEVIRFQKISKKRLVLFMDEFHLIAKVSPAGLQALKPLLAESGRYNVRFIAATTFEEFDKYIRPDEALTERLQRINLEPPSDKVVIQILKNFIKFHNPEIHIHEELYEEIVKITNKYIPAEQQPRKSIKVLDAMVGWHKQYNLKFDKDLLAKVMKDSVGVDLDWKVNVEHLLSYLNNRVKDQKLASTAIADRLYMSVSGLNDPSRPQASFLFTGSTGVGKTEMAKALTQSLMGDENKMIRFDMSEYSDPSTVNTFREQLATYIWEHPSSVVLLDEIEKSHRNVTRLLLQVLDDARLSDRHGRQVSFKDAYIILTTNVGQEVYKQFQKDNNIQVEKLDAKDARLVESLKDYTKLIRRSLLADTAFPTELINRLDAVVPFAPLQRSTYIKIAKMRLTEFKEQLYDRHSVVLHIDQDVLSYLVDEHLDTSTDSGGGRGIKRKIDTDIIARVARLLAFHPEVTDVAVSIEGQFAHTNKFDRIGSAKVKVSQWTGSKRLTF